MLTVILIAIGLLACLLNPIVGLLIIIAAILWGILAKPAKHEPTEEDRSEYRAVRALMQAHQNKIEAERRAAQPTESKGRRKIVPES